MRIALCIIATGKYDRFVAQLIGSARRYFLRGHDVHFIVFSDVTPTAAVDIHHYPTAHENWPGPTLHRYRTMLTAANDLRRYDYIFYVDVDATFVGDVPDSILGNIVATRHSGYRDSPKTEFPYMHGPASAAHIPRGQGQYYYAGGFQGGTSTAFITAMEACAAAIALDEQHNIIAEWHDESHWNRYLLTRRPDVVLDREYHWPDNFAILPNQKISLISKDHTAMRSIDIYDAPPYLYLKNWPQGDGRLREEVIQQFHCGRNIRPASIDGVQAVVTYHNSSGLCNRLRAFVGGALLADYYDLPHYYCWEPSVACPSKFDTLFSYSQALTIPAPLVHLLSSRDNIFWIADSYDKTNPLHYPGSSPLSLFYEQLQHSMTAQEFLDRASAKMRSIQLLPHLLDRVESYIATWPAKVIGVHIRRTDQIANAQHCYQVSLNDDGVLAAMRSALAADQSTHFFLAADNGNTVEEFRRIFGDAILASPVSYKVPDVGGAARHTDISDAVFDLYCLSRTERLFGTWMSTFSHYAVDLGGIPNEQFC